MVVEERPTDKGPGLSRRSRGRNALHFLTRWSMFFLKFLLSQWQILGIGFAILFAYLFPDVGRKGGVIKSQYSISYGAVGIIFLISGLGISTHTLITNITKIRLHLVVQVTSYLIFSGVVFGIVSAIRASGTDKIDTVILVGLIVMGCIPTTISSNIVMTRAARGNDSATLIQVTLGNFLGPFLSPALTRMYLTSSPAFDGYVPGSNGVGQLYADVFQLLGCALFAPFFVGQAIQYFFPKQTNWAMNKFYLNKVGSFCLLLIVWATFSSAFYYQALEHITHEAVILMVLLNITLYTFFTFFALFISRPPIPSHLLNSNYLTSHTLLSKALHKLFYRFSKRDTIAICFCAPAKSVSIGSPLITVMWSVGFSNEVESLVAVPLILYSAEQIFCGQIAVMLFRWWGRDEWPENQRSEVETQNGDLEGRAESSEAAEVLQEDCNRSPNTLAVLEVDAGKEISNEKLAELSVSVVRDTLS